MKTNRTVIPAEPGWSVAQWFYDAPCSSPDHPVMAWEIDPEEGRLYPVTLFHGSLLDQCRKWGMPTYALRHPKGRHPDGVVTDWNGQTIGEEYLSSIIPPYGGEKKWIAEQQKMHDGPPPEKKDASYYINGQWWMSLEEAEANDPEYAEHQRRCQRRKELVEELKGLVGMDVDEALKDWRKKCMRAAAWEDIRLWTNTNACSQKGRVR
jgi:hypothetical protein